MKYISFLCFVVGVGFSLLALIEPFSLKLMLIGLLTVLEAIYLKPTDEVSK